MAGAFGRGEWPGASLVKPAPGRDAAPSESTGEVLGESEFGVAGEDQPLLATSVDRSVESGGTGDAAKGGELPFTGLVLGGLLLSGMLLLASGLGVRRTTRLTK